MKLSIVSSALLLGAATAPAAAKQPLVFGRPMRRRVSPVDGARRNGKGPARGLRQRRWAKVSKSPTSVLSPYKMMHKAVAKGSSAVESKASKESALSPDEAGANKSAHPVDSKKSRKSTLSGDAESESKKSASSPDKSAESKTSTASADSASSPDESAESKTSTASAESKASKKTASSATKKSSSSRDAPADTKRSKSRRSKTSKYFGSEDSFGKGFYAEFSMSMSMSLGFDDDIMSFSFDYSTPYTAVSTSSHSGDAVAIVDDKPFAPEPGSLMDFGWVAFEYLRQCSDISGADLEYSCLVAETVNAFMGTNDDDLFGRLRRLGTSKTPDDECYPREATEQTLRPLMNTARGQCLSQGSTVSNDEFDDILRLLLRVLSNTDCERALCFESSSPLMALVAVIFSQAAECAGVNLEMEQCAMDHIMLLMTSIGSAPQDFGLCNRPSDNNYDIVANFMVIDAAAKCYETGVRMTDEAWRKVQSDLVKIFTDARCWGIGDCDDGPDTSSGDEFGSILADDGRACTFEPDIYMDPDLERDLELVFFYQVQTVSEDESLLESSLANIEGALIRLSCGFTDGGRSRSLQEFPLDTVPVALYSTPEDVVTDYTCSPETPRCNIIEGKMTLTVVGDTAEYDQDIILGFDSIAAEMFAFLPTVLDDEFGNSNVVDVRYIGLNPPPVTNATTGALVDLTAKPPAADEPLEKLPADDQPAEEPGDAPEDAPTISSSNNAEQESAFQVIAIAASASVVAAIVLAAGYRRLQDQDELEAREDKLDVKSHGSNDGQSTAYHTADLTYAASTANVSMSSASSCDRSDASSLPSPARSLDGPLSPEVHRTSPAKFFVLAEEEDANWRDLSILPQLAQDDGTLEDVSEEGEFINSVSSGSRSSSSGADSHGQISV